MGIISQDTALLFDAIAHYCQLDDSALTLFTFALIFWRHMHWKVKSRRMQHATWHYCISEGISISLSLSLLTFALTFWFDMIWRHLDPAPSLTLTAMGNHLLKYCTILIFANWWIWSLFSSCVSVSVTSLKKCASKVFSMDPFQSWPSLEILHSSDSWCSLLIRFTPVLLTLEGWGECLIVYSPSCKWSYCKVYHLSLALVKSLMIICNMISLWWSGFRHHRNWCKLCLDQRVNHCAICEFTNRTIAFSTFFPINIKYLVRMVATIGEVLIAINPSLPFKCSHKKWWCYDTFRFWSFGYLLVIGISDGQFLFFLWTVSNLCCCYSEDL